MDDAVLDVHTRQAMSRTKKSAAVRQKISKQKKKGDNAAKKRRQAKESGGEVAKAAPSSGDVDTGSESALEYLERWVAHSAGQGEWKFSMRRQLFLLKHWPDRERVPNTAFKHLLLYFQNMPEALTQKTIEAARKVAADAEAQEAEADAAAEEAGDDGDDDGEAEERKALLKIQRARALRVLEAMLEEADA